MCNQASGQINDEAKLTMAKHLEEIDHVYNIE